MKKLTKQEKREQIAHKIKNKEKFGATLAGQIKRTQTTKSFSGNVKKIIK